MPFCPQHPHIVLSSLGIEVSSPPLQLAGQELKDLQLEERPRARGGQSDP